MILGPQGLLYGQPSQDSEVCVFEHTTTPVSPIYFSGATPRNQCSVDRTLPNPVLSHFNYPWALLAVLQFNYPWVECLVKHTRSKRTQALSLGYAAPGTITIISIGHVSCWPGWCACAGESAASPVQHAQCSDRAPASAQGAQNPVQSPRLHHEDPCCHRGHCSARDSSRYLPANGKFTCSLSSGSI